MNSKDWPIVRKALDDRRWDFRTVEGIARQTGLRPECVKEELKHHQNQIRQTLARDGRPVYTLKSRPRKWREIVAELHTFATGSVRVRERA